MITDTARQQLRDMLKQLRLFAETKAGECATDVDRAMYWRALGKVEEAENILVPRNLAGECPEATPVVGGLDELDGHYERLARRSDPEAGA